MKNVTLNNMHGRVLSNKGFIEQLFTRLMIIDKNSLSKHMKESIL